MDDDLALLRRARMRWNTPLSVAHADSLLDRLDLDPGPRVVDLGCGWGELLMCAVERVGGDHARAVGVDTDPVVLERGRTLARRRGLDERIEFVQADAATWSGTAERALCVGSSHAFGDTQAALDAMTALVPPGGRLLFGDGFWQTTPGPAAVDIFGDQIRTLAELVDSSRSAGWRIIHLSTADQREWDEFESTSRAGLQAWLLANGADPRAEEVRNWLDEREHRYFHDYRGVLGFAYLVLAH
ncbi:SAM-dependent methyltransferase [Amycolatopsis nigrescens]|uniref:SAM-dependent methyltransferase n=1 Tax=Amycolatopsis nigrescens TaxID=381445 RepID=UPI0003AA7940|nr:class I SAM-dependent methyltransferase [Amycolatopsis nigrescens]